MGYHLVENLKSGELGCGYVNEAGQYRAAIAADAVTPLRFGFMPGLNLPVAKNANFVKVLSSKPRLNNLERPFLIRTKPSMPVSLLYPLWMVWVFEDATQI